MQEVNLLFSLASGAILRVDSQRLGVGRQEDWGLLALGNSHALQELCSTAAFWAVWPSHWWSPGSGICSCRLCQQPYHLSIV